MKFSLLKGSPVLALCVSYLIYLRITIQDYSRMGKSDLVGGAHCEFPSSELMDHFIDEG
jgi:hypothetical protein